MTNPPEGGERPSAPAGDAPQPQYRRPPVPPPAPRPHPHPPRSEPLRSDPAQYAAPAAGPPRSAPPTYGQPWAAPQYPQQYAPPACGPAPHGPPPHGSFPYTPGAPPAPARRRGRAVIRALAGGVVVVAAIAVVLAMVLGTRVLDRAAVQRDVAAQFREHEGVAIRLRCDDSMELTTGATYRCAGTTADGEHVTLQIRVTDARNARYTWSEQR